MKTRLVIITELIAPYRIPVFNALARRQEIDLHVLFLAETNPAVRLWRIYRDEICFSHQVLPSWRTRLGKHDVLLNHDVSNALQRAAPDVILCGGYNYLASWQAQRWARRNHVPFLLWSESTGQDERAGRQIVEFLKRSFFDSCDGYVVPGTAARNYAAAMGAAPDRIFLAPNAVDVQLFASAADSARANASRLRSTLGLPSRYLLFVGRLLKAKGVFDLLEAYARLPEELRSQVGVVLAGDGPFRAVLEAQARSIYPGTIHFPGFVQRDELANYYGLAEFFVFPTHSDPWGLVVNEAMASRLPVICSSVAGCALDLIKTNGRVVDRGNVPQLAYAMEEFSRSSRIREQMGRQGREIIENYSPELCAMGIANAAVAQTSTNIRSEVNMLRSREMLAESESLFSSK